MKMNNTKLGVFAACIILYFALMSGASADIYINLVAVNGRDDPKTSMIHF